MSSLRYSLKIDSFSKEDTVYADRGRKLVS